MKRELLLAVAAFCVMTSAAAKPMGGKCSPLDAHKQWLLKLIATEPDLTLEEIRGRLRELGIAVSASSVCRFCDRHDVTFKKKPARRRTRPQRRPHGPHELEARAAAA